MSKKQINKEVLISDINTYDYNLEDFYDDNDMEFGEGIDLTADEWNIIHQVKLDTDDNKVVLDLDDIMGNDEFEGNYPLLNTILTETIPVKLKETLSETFGGAENIRVKIPYGLSYIDENENKKDHYDLNELPSDPSEIEVVMDSHSRFNNTNEDFQLEEVANMKEKLDEFKDSITESIGKIEGIFHYAKNYSDWENKKIGVNIKVYNMSFPDADEVSKALIEKGYTKESIRKAVTDERMSSIYQQHLQDGIMMLDEYEGGDIEFLGTDGRMSGYAVFKVDFINMNLDEDYSDWTISDFENEGIDILDDAPVNADSLERFSEWIENTYNSVCKGRTLDEMVEYFEDDGEVETAQEEKERLEAEAFEESRPRTETQRATKEFKMDGETYITHWGENRLPLDRLYECRISMGTAHFNADELTANVIFENLNDGKFGVQSINGGNVWVDQKIETTRVYGDNQEKEVYHTWERVLNGEIVDPESDISGMLTDEYISPLVQETIEKNKSKREDQKEQKNESKNKKGV